MNNHIAFSASGCPTVTAARIEDRFEVLEAARECARRLEAAGWFDVECCEIRARPLQYPGDSGEEHLPVEFQIHVVGARA